MNLRDLEYACAVADHGHFGHAAAACHVSQPTLSGQIRKLEDALGVTLFERTNKSVRLTPVGADIVAVARDILQRAADIERIADGQKDPAAGPLRIGMIPTIAPYLIPLIVEPLRKRLPKLEPVFVEAITDDLLEQLHAGTLDCAVLATEHGDPQLDDVPLYREPFWLALPRGHALEHTATITLDNIAGENLLLLTDGHCFRDQALAFCQRDPEDDHTNIAATSFETIINLVGAGQGLTLVPALAIKGAWSTDLGVIAHKIEDKGAHRDVHLYFRSAFPRRAVLDELSGLIAGVLPNTVEPFGD